MARPVRAGDVVTIVKHVADYIGCYGAPARHPFTVEGVRRVFGERRIVCTGGGMLVFRAYVKRVPREPRK
jgi:hypothetical protein